mmetsp:Transcript_5088/g.18464  ORF Transcript_5088/g.18464 Transcript_5088/m.18464 type:complete len:469 (-) Transcript_5088:287-1693(-)
MDLNVYFPSRILLVLPRVLALHLRAVVGIRRVSCGRGAVRLLRRRGAVRWLRGDGLVGRRERRGDRRDFVTSSDALGNARRRSVRRERHQRSFELARTFLLDDALERLTLEFLFELFAERRHQVILVREQRHQTRLVRGRKPARHHGSDTPSDGARLGGDARHESVFIITRAVGANVLNQISAVVLSVLGANFNLFFLRAVNEHGNQTPIIVGHPALEGFLQVDSDLLSAGRQQAHERFTEESAFKQTSGFVANAFTQELASCNLVCFTELFDLLVGLVRQEVNDGTFIGAHTFNGVAHRLHVGRVVHLGIVVDVRRVTLRESLDDALEITRHGPFGSYSLDEILLEESGVSLPSGVELFRRRRNQQTNHSLAIRTQTSNSRVDNLCVGITDAVATSQEQHALELTARFRKHCLFHRTLVTRAVRHLQSDDILLRQRTQNRHKRGFVGTETRHGAFKRLRLKIQSIAQ